MRPAFDEVIGPNMLRPLRPKTDARSVIQQEPALLGLSQRHPQPLPPPYPHDTLHVHGLACIPKKNRDPAVAVAPILGRERHNIRGQRAFVGAAPRYFPLCRAMLPKPATDDALRKRRTFAGYERYRLGGGRGLVVSQGSLSQDQLLERHVRDSRAQPLVLPLEFLQTLHLAGLQPAELLAPTVIGVLRPPDRSNRLRSARRYQQVGLPKLRDDLLRRVPLLSHSFVLHLAQKAYFREDHFSGVRPVGLRYLPRYHNIPLLRKCGFFSLHSYSSMDFPALSCHVNRYEHSRLNCLGDHHRP